MILILAIGGVGCTSSDRTNVAHKPSVAAKNVEKSNRPPPAFTVTVPTQKVNDGTDGSSRPASQRLPLTNIRAINPPVHSEPAKVIHGPIDWRGSHVSWSVPNGWSQMPGTQKRLATLRPDASVESEVAITEFPGDVGGPLANVNRWRKELGLSPIGEDDLQHHVSQFEAGAIHGAFIDITGPQDQPRRSIIVSLPHDGKTTFIKFIGTASDVGLNIETFVQFAKSIRFHHPVE